MLIAAKLINRLICIIDCFELLCTMVSVWKVKFHRIRCLKVVYNNFQGGVKTLFQIKRRNIVREFQMEWKGVPEVRGRVIKAFFVQLFRCWLCFELNLNIGHKLNLAFSDIILLLFLLDMNLKYLSLSTVFFNLFFLFVVIAVLMFSAPLRTITPLTTDMTRTEWAD